MYTKRNYRQKYIEWREKQNLSPMPSNFQVHHIKPKSICLLDGWDENRIHSPSNLIGLHPDDHESIHKLRGDHRDKTSSIWLMASANRRWDDEEWRKYHSEQTSKATRKWIQENDTKEARSLRAKKVWENDEYKKERSLKVQGSGNANSKLSEDDVVLIRYTIWPILQELVTTSGCGKRGITKTNVCKMIGDMFNVSHTPIRKIVENKSWKNI